MEQDLSKIRDILPALATTQAVHAAKEDMIKTGSNQHLDAVHAIHAAKDEINKSLAQRLEELTRSFAEFQAEFREFRGRTSVEIENVKRKGQGAGAD